ncbi:hypothetical protein MAPG_08025 [Magnaporthiopsis poae ATCC 64411]|uniref:Uncharacterized protein n=1 Tax=Magnaporthiopsis poae (strain ATCC 64411 / 73-15) TaxID=644358 RepID=A0A0C4E695_MAGP6|nr:hypothetical protein MAPG_08025 [Magnaporthiopsis poae ATCC 64411]
MDGWVIGNMYVMRWAERERAEFFRVMKSKDGQWMDETWTPVRLCGPGRFATSVAAYRLVVPSPGARARENPRPEPPLASPFGPSRESYAESGQPVPAPTAGGSDSSSLGEGQDE